MLIIIFSILALILLVIALVILVKSRNDEINGYYDAAHNILKEQQLDSMLKNPYGGNAYSNTDGVKTMAYLKLKGRNDCKYVFNLEHEVCIGRDKSQNQICVNEAIVSQNHCRIYANGSNVYIQDLNSANGLEVKRGLSRYALSRGQAMELRSKDVVKVGTTQIIVVIFYFDSTIM